MVQSWPIIKHHKNTCSKEIGPHSLSVTNYSKLDHIGERTWNNKTTNHTHIPCMFNYAYITLALSGARGGLRGYYVHEIWWTIIEKCWHKIHSSSLSLPTRCIGFKQYIWATQSITLLDVVVVAESSLHSWTFTRAQKTFVNCHYLWPRLMYTDSQSGNGNGMAPKSRVKNLCL
jgi:hypothetical protein